MIKNNWGIVDNYFYSVIIFKNTITNKPKEGMTMLISSVSYSITATYIVHA